MFFSMHKQGLQWYQAMLSAAMVWVLPVFMFVTVPALAAESTDASAAQSESMQAEPTQAAVSNNGFDLSFPVDFNRCQMTRELNAYVDKLAPDDVEGLMKVQKFLVDCQGLMEQYLNKTQAKLSELKANTPAPASASVPAATDTVQDVAPETTAKTAP